MDTTYTIAEHFEGKEPKVQAIYDLLLAQLRTLGPVKASPKKGSIHLDRSSGFAGVYTRKSYILLHFRTAEAIEDPAIQKCEQLSKNRFKNTVRLDTEADINGKLLDWLTRAYSLAG